MQPALSFLATDTSFFGSPLQEAQAQVEANEASGPCDKNRHREGIAGRPPLERRSHNQENPGPENGREGEAEPNSPQASGKEIYQLTPITVKISLKNQSNP